MELVYPFANEFIVGLTSLILSDTAYGARVLSVVDPALMPTKASKRVYAALQSGVRITGNVPSVSSTRQLLHQQYISGAFDEEALMSVRRLLRDAVRTKALPRAEAQPILKEAVLQSKLGEALRNALRAYKSGELGACKTLVDGAFDEARRLDLGSIGRSIRHKLDEYVKDVRDGKAVLNRIPTGIYELDSKIDGGLGRGELGCWLGGRKAGKSMLLCYIAATAVLCGLNVVYITLELEKLDVENRIGCCLVGMDLKALTRRKNWASRELSRKLTDVFESNNNVGTYIAKKFPPKTITVKDIEMYLRDVQAYYNLEVDVLIVDYADDMLATTKEGNESGYTRGDHVYAELKALGSTPDNAYGIHGGFNCAVWTVSQVQRNAMDDDLITMSSVDKSIDKASKVDFLGSICKTVEEKEDNMARLYIAACRYAPGDRGYENIVGAYVQEEERGRFFNVDEAGQIRSVQEWKRREEALQKEKAKTVRTRLRIPPKVCSVLRTLGLGR